MSHAVAIPYPTLADRLLPHRTAARDAALVVGGSLALAGLAQVAIPLPFTPVPLTGQTLGVLLLGLALGGRLGGLATVLYLAEGAAGLPFFAAGAGGLAAFRGASAGYLLAFPAAAFLAGRLAERRGADRTAGGTLLAMAVGHAVIYAVGGSWLAGWLRLAGQPAGIGEVLALGVLPFLPGDVLKALAAAGLAGWARRRRDRGRNRGVPLA